jgi:hypothetical protein
MMRVFRPSPVSDGRRLGDLQRIEISQSLESQNSLVVGKNAGNFAESAHFCENPSRKRPRIQSLRVNTLREGVGNFLARAGNFFGAQGIWREIDPRVPAHPAASKVISVEDKTIIYERR